MKKKIGYREAFSFLIRLCRPMGKEQRTFWFGSLLEALEMLNTLLIPFVFQQMIQLVSGAGEGGAGGMAGILFLLAVVLFITPFISLGSYLNHRTAIRGKNNMRLLLFSHMQRLSVTEIQKRDTGEALTLLSSDVDRAYGLLQGFGIRACCQFLVAFPITAAILIYYCPPVAALAIPVSLATIWISAVFNPKVSRLGQEAQKEMGASAGPLIELIQGYQAVRMFSGYQRMLERFTEICRRIFRKRVHYRTINGIVDGFLNFFQTAAQPFTLVVALFLILAGRCSIDTAVLVSSIASVMADRARGVGTFIANMQPPMESARRIFAVLDLPEEAERQGGAELQKGAGCQNETDRQDGTGHQNGMKKGTGAGGTACPGENPVPALSIRGLSFSYPESGTVLKDFSCEVADGETVVLTGPSGCGKTTLFRLIQALYEPQAGEIRYFGVPGARLQRSQIRDLIAYVPQECSLFDGSIGYNIRLGNPSAGLEEVEEAARTACIDAFIHSLPEEYETQVGEKGAQLSGGQRQRIAIARAFLKDAPLLLLDEPTSALDAQTERDIWEALQNLMKGRTVLVISHQTYVPYDREIRLGT